MDKKIIACSLIMVLLMPSCTGVPKARWPNPLRQPGANAQDMGAKAAAQPQPQATNPADGSAYSTLGNGQKPKTTIERTPAPPASARQTSQTPSVPPDVKPRKGETANITLNFDQEKLPTLIQLVYGTILKRNYTLDPLIAERNDLVTLRTGPQTPSQVEQTVRILLRSYGVAVIENQGMIRVIPEEGLKSFTPEIRRGYADPRTPAALRPVFQLVELKYVKNLDILVPLRNIFGTKITLQEDNYRNAIMLSGQPEDIAAALDAITVLDQPGLKGRYSARVNPVYLNADQLAGKLVEILQAEGYSATASAGGGAPPTTAVNLIPVKPLNAVLIFAADQAALSHTLEWAREIDHPVAYGHEPGFFTYQAQNTDAQKLAETLTEMLSAPGDSVRPGLAADAKAEATPANPAAGAISKHIVVNAGTNTLIFKGSSEEYSRIRNLLEGLDKPTKAAVIEVTVAEVDLKDSLELGVELSSDMLKEGAFTALTGGAGLTVKYLRPGSTAATDAIKALATQNRAHILSSPRLMARNGETATIQVGQQVPFPSSQLGSASNSSIIPGTGTLLTTVQYKDVGVILKVKPIIYSGERIELEVSQEVSDAVRTTTGVTDAPTINTKKVQTRLALRDGSTVMLGGLISNRDSQSSSGVPLLKDLPVLGPLFGFTTESDARQELIILITPYTILDDFEAREITSAFRHQLGPWANPGHQGPISGESHY